MWQEFHTFHHSLIRKLRWRWKTCQTHLASLSHVYKYFLSKQWFYTVSGTFLQINSANMLRWNICVVEALSMLTSLQIKTVKPPDKKPGISDRSSSLRRRRVKFQFVWQNCVTTFPCSGCFKSMLAYVIHPQNTKNPSCVWYCTMNNNNNNNNNNNANIYTG